MNDDLQISSERLKKDLQAGIDQADRGELLEHDVVFSQLRALANAAVTSKQEP